MNYTKIKVLSAVLTVVFIAGIEYIRHTLWLSRVSPKIDIILSLSILIMGALLFTQFVFSLITRLEREKEEKAAELSALYGNSKDGILMLDKNKQMIDMNSAVIGILGITREDLLQKYFSEIIGTDLSFDLLEREQEKEVYIQTKEGQKIVELVIYPLELKKSEKKYAVILRDLTDKKKLEEELHSQIQNVAILKERERIAREMHDGLAQLISSIHIKVQLLSKLNENAKDGAGCPILNDHIHELREIVEKSYQEVRQNIYSLKTSLNPEKGFIHHIKQYLEGFEKQNHFTIHFDTNLSEEYRFSDSMELQLLRIIQEALHNVRRHANATEVEVSINQIPADLIQIKIKDNGKGFSFSEVKKKKDHFGLSIMKERTEIIDGQFYIQSQEGRGTTVIIEVPKK
ncbi:sensor histidine kinase [Microaerobacter geothermalis]|uniref:sensor histidine kinase n=1 Tax=Microaerobacter geothermalis TaxID=674972 RepID=UPI001F447603|nr:sensor histidine kinase [Microaerobacter geothermalis]MCF6092520.1 sensor histidine kinase [Microaerobacter geothermalis]